MRASLLCYVISEGLPLSTRSRDEKSRVSGGGGDDDDKWMGGYRRSIEDDETSPFWGRMTDSKLQRMKHITFKGLSVRVPSRRGFALWLGKATFRGST